MSNEFCAESLFFDAYVVSVHLTDADLLRDRICKELDLDFVATRPKFGYAVAYRLYRGDINHGLIQFGGDNVGGGIYVSILGSMAGAFRDFLLAWRFEYGVLRADVAFDSVGSVFVEVARISQELIRDRNLSSSVAGDWVNGTGRTLYIGSRQSLCFGRIYEKWVQLGLPKESAFDRIEFEFKPHKKSRVSAASLEPIDFIKSSRWASDLCNQLFAASLFSSLSLDRHRAQSDHNRALAHLVKQYRKTIVHELDNSAGCVDTLIRTLLFASPSDILQR